jgi:hypothetical protein
MNANLTAQTVSKEFNDWQELEEYLIVYKDKKQMHRLDISLQTAQTFWQYIFDMDTNSVLQVVYALKDIEHKVDEIWEKYLDALPGDSDDW